MRPIDWKWSKQAGICSNRPDNDVWFFCLCEELLIGARKDKQVTDVIRCPKCNDEMVRGFILDITHGARLQVRWSPGQAQRSYWTATKAPGETIVVGTFRCRSCGYLESYARDEFAAQ
jgi:hypothetical protein